MELCILSLITTTPMADLPEGLWFNDCHVAMRALRFQWEDKKARVRIRLEAMRVNGLWYSASGVMGPTWGYFEPLSVYGEKGYQSFDEAIDSIKCKTIQYLGQNNVVLPKWEAQTLSLKDFVSDERSVWVY